MVYICRQHKIVQLPHDLKQLIVDRFGRILIAVDVNIAAPVRPMLLQCPVRIKSCRIHILKTIFFYKICKIVVKSFASVSKARRCGQPCTCANQDSVRVLDFLTHSFHSARCLEALLHIIEGAFCRFERPRL